MLPRSSALFGYAIHGWGRFKQALEVLTEAGDVAVADTFGDAGNRKPGGAQKFGSFFQTESLQVGLEAEFVLLAEEAGEIAWAGEGDLVGNMREL